MTVSAHSKKTAHGAGKQPAGPGGAGGATRRGDSDASAAALRPALQAGCARLGLALAPRQQEQLLAYLALLRKWNKVYNLTAIRALPDMLVEHLFDSLAVLGPLAARLKGVPSALRVVDIGSGAGLPGIPIAIAWPQAVVHLVEPVGKKAAFLRQCAGALGLDAVQVHELRVEDLRLAEPPDLIICRAFASLTDFLAAAAPLAGTSTLVCAMKGAVPAGEIAALGAPWGQAEVVPLAVPELEAARHLVLVRSAGAGRAGDESTGATPAPSSRNGA